MKKIACILISGLMLCASCNKMHTSVKMTTQLDSVSYCIGVHFAKGMKNNNNMDAINPELVAKGFQQVFANDSIKFTDQQLNMIVQSYLVKISNAIAEKNLKEGMNYLEKNKQKPGVKVLPSGLQYEVLKTGTGSKPDSTKIVSINYKVSSIEGKVIEQNKPGQPAKLPVYGVMKGVSQALGLMTVGSKWLLTIPSDLAYGPRGNQAIKPNSTLIFELELLSMEDKPQPKASPVPARRR
jgi:FKBP-type peptidyl-prolyl cis-trans isomerase FklB